MSFCDLGYFLIENSWMFFLLFFVFHFCVDTETKYIRKHIVEATSLISLVSAILYIPL